MNKQVSQMNKWKQILLLSTGVFFSTASLAEEATYGVTLTWGAVEFADSYRLEERLATASWEDDSVVVVDSNSTSVTLTNRAADKYVYRVVGCVTNPNASQVLCDEVAEYSADYALSLPLSDSAGERRVIFIHTDLLGSPVAETDEEGKIL